MRGVRSARMLSVLAVCGCGLAAVGLGGCKSVATSEYDRAVTEAMELRGELDRTRGQLAESEARYAASSAENDQLRGNLDFERQRASQPAPTPVVQYGFEGIEGVTSRMTNEGLVLTVENDILFDSGKVELRATAKRSLDRVASTINERYSGRMIRVEGYTDSDPIRKSKWESNERLSGERALAVEKYLISRGISADTIYFAGFGASNPRGSKKDSRRVEIVIAR